MVRRIKPDSSAISDAVLLFPSFYTKVYLGSSGMRAKAKATLLPLTLGYFSFESEKHQ